MILKARSFLMVLCILLVCGCSSGGGSDDPNNPDNPGGDPTPVNTVKTPTFNYESGSYSSIMTLTMSCETVGATIHYTLDGSAPTVDSPTYTGIVPVRKKTTVKALAIKDGMNISSVKTTDYEIHSYNKNESGDGWAYYYDNGVKKYLTMPSDRAHFASRGIFESENGEVYVFGYTYNIHKDYDTYIIDEQPCYWKDGIYHALPLPSGLTVHDMSYGHNYYKGVLYLVGTIHDKDVSYPCYWKGDECIVLDDNGDIGGGICVTDNGDVYVPGSYDDGSYDGYADGDQPVYWQVKGNTPAKRMGLDNPDDTEGRANQALVDGLNLYLSGEVNGHPCYWKNWDLFMLDEPKTSTYGEVCDVTTSGMLVNNNDLYIGGFATLGGALGTTQTPMYWKNGVATIIPIPDKTVSMCGIWWFTECDSTVIPRGTWSNSTSYGELCVINGTVYLTEYSK